MDNPFFSVILNTHNSSSTITRTIESVFNQSFHNYEIIVVDDSSSDDTLSIVNRIADKHYYRRKLKIIALKGNRGISYARNLGVEKGKGQYIAFLDGDDLWHKEKLRIQHDFILKNKPVDWVFGNYDVINGSYKKLGKRKRKCGIYDFKGIISDGNPVGLLTVVVKRDILLENKFHSIRHEDYDLWIRLAKKGIMGYLIDNDLGCYMKRNGSTSGNKILSIKWTYEVFRKNQISIFLSIYFLIRYVFNYFMRKSN